MTEPKACAPPTHDAFDIDIYDCPCGHMYGDHDYRWVNNTMVIVHCETCGVEHHENRTG